MGFIIIALLVIFIVIPCLIITFSKSQAKGILKEICSSHKINQSFVTSAGCLAFSDDEKKIHFYSTTTHNQVAISYSNLVRCGNFDATSNLILFDAMNPKLTQYQFGAQNADRMNEILKKMESILNVNLAQAKKDYESKISTSNQIAIAYGDLVMCCSTIKMNLFFVI